MNNDTSLPLIRSSENSTPAARSLLRRRVVRGELVRIALGCYVEKSGWQLASATMKYRTRIAALARDMPAEAQFSHESAAAIYRLPTVRAWPLRMHQVVAARGGGSSTHSVFRHTVLRTTAGFDARGSVIDGIPLTSLARTVTDLARNLDFTSAVVMIDDALRTPRQGEFRWERRIAAPLKRDILSGLELQHPRFGYKNAVAAITFADGGSGSPMESLCRVQFRALGYPPPQLQTEIVDAAGSIGFVDFYWPELELVVEYDGRTKYGNARQFQKGINPQEVLWQEKMREDRMRRVVRGFARIYRESVVDLHTLHAQLGPFGLRRDSWRP